MVHATVYGSAATMASKTPPRNAIHRRGSLSGGTCGRTIWPTCPPRKPPGTRIVPVLRKPPDPTVTAIRPPPAPPPHAPPPQRLPPLPPRALSRVSSATASACTRMPPPDPPPPPP